MTFSYLPLNLMTLGIRRGACTEALEVAGIAAIRNAEILLL